MSDANCPTCGAELRPTSIGVGSLFVDRRLRFARWKEREIHLTSQEAGVVEFLARRADKLVPKWALHEQCFSDDTDIKIVDVIVCKVRKKFQTVDGDFAAIETVWGEGYLWRADGPPMVPADPEEARRRRVERARAA